jgi:hypothetical protein
VVWIARCAVNKAISAMHLPQTKLAQQVMLKLRVSKNVAYTTDHLKISIPDSSNLSKKDWHYFATVD